MFVLPAPGERLPADVADELQPALALRAAPLVVVAHFLLPPRRSRVEMSSWCLIDLFLMYMCTEISFYSAL